MVRPIYHPGPLWPGSGVNYGNDRAFNAYFNADAIRNELVFLRRYFTKIRIFVPHYSYGNTHSIVTNCLAIIDQAVSLGFTEVVWGITCSESTLTAAHYPAYKAACLTRAQVAASHGVTSFVVGNEEEYHVDNSTLTRAQIEASIRDDLAPATKAVFSNQVSYNFAAGVLSDWLNSGKGALDTIGMNVYGNDEYDGTGFCRDVRNFYNAFGSTAYISEYGLHYDWDAVTMNDYDQYIELTKRRQFVQSSGLSASYFFLFMHLHTDDFAARLANGRYRSMWKALIQERFAWDGQANTPFYRLQRPRL